MKITAVQMNSRDDFRANVAAAEIAVTRAAQEERADIVVFPEYFHFLDDHPARTHGSADHFDEIVGRLSTVARENGIVVHAGSIVEPADGRFFNTTLVFDARGERIARYRKIHLFDFDNPNGTSHRESDHVSRGDQIIVYDAGDLKIGCTICYDLRFPELFRSLRGAGAEVIMVPAAFTLNTGKDHWEVLLRARAIETQTYVVAAAQVHTFAEGRRPTWGHSMIIDPWGAVIAQASDREGLITAHVDRDYLADVRRRLPVAQHQVLP